MNETLIVAFTTLFATVGPVDVAAVFAVLTADDTPRSRRNTAVKGTIIGGILLLTLLLLLLATQVQRWLGVTGLQVITRVFGVLLVALAVQFIFDGILESGIVG